VWKGSAYGGWKSRDSVPKLVESYLGGKFMVDEFVTGEVPLTDIKSAFDLMHAGKGWKTGKSKWAAISAEAYKSNRGV
jgi:S-(hydroxymethyl)glutathione dehydrogenase/alcohol dehydrogenase